MIAVHTADTGCLVSVGTVVTDPLPSGLAATPLTAADARSLRDGTGRWDEATRAVVPLPADPAVANETTIRNQARQALAANRTFLDIASQTQAQTLAQVRRLTEQMQRVIRLALGEFDGTD